MKGENSDGTGRERDGEGRERERRGGRVCRGNGAGGGVQPRGVGMGGRGMAGGEREGGREGKRERGRGWFGHHGSTSPSCTAAVGKRGGSRTAAGRGGVEGGERERRGSSRRAACGGELYRALETFRFLETHFRVDVVTPLTEVTALYDSIFEQFNCNHSGTIDREEFRREMQWIMLAITDGLSSSPIQITLKDDD